MQRVTMRSYDLRLRRSLAALPALLTTSLLASSAFAQAVTVDTTTAGAPPADQKALVAAPAAAPAAPDLDTKASDSQSATVSAGGQLSTGNSKLVAGTGNAIYAIRRGQNAFGASVIGNYGESAVRPNDAVLTTENLQGKVRYDRFLTDRFSLFGLVTARHDYFQGLDFRLNLDPGAKYIFVKTEHTAFWGEAGYDFQQDIRNNTARHIAAVTDATTGAVTTPAYSLERYHPDHSTRLYAGWHHDFNEHVNFTTGLEYLQSVEASYRNRLNYDVLLAAGVGAGFSVGVGFSLRYDHSPIPGKTDLDTVTTFSLIYAFTDKKADAAPAQLANCPCTEVNPAAAPPSSGTPPPPADGPAPRCPGDAARCGAVERAPARRTRPPSNRRTSKGEHHGAVRRLQEVRVQGERGRPRRRRESSAPPSRRSSRRWSTDLIMLRLILPSGDWRESSFILKTGATPKDNVSIKYGDFAGNILDFLIVAFVLFLIVSRIIKAAESRFAKKDDKPAVPVVKECPFCLENVPAKATKCKACTSTFPEKAAGQAGRQARRCHREAGRRDLN